MPAKQKKRLTIQQSRFVLEYLRDQNGKRAAIRVGVAEGSAAAMAWRWLNTPRIRAEVDAALADEARANGALRARIREELCAIAFARADERDMAVVSQMSFFPDGRLAAKRNWSKTQALATLLKYYAMPTESQGADDITRAIAEVESGLELYETQLDALVEAVEQSEAEPSSPL